MKKIFFSMLIIGTAAAFSCNSGTGSDNKNDTTNSNTMANEQNEKKFDTTNMENDAEFAVFAADGSMAEVQMGNLALKTSSNKTVKDAAQMIVKDHQQANEELKPVAQQNNITLPATMSDEHKKKYDDLAGKKGADFDKAFLDIMEDGHKKTIDKFQTEADNGKNATLKQWAAGKLPTLRHHLEMIQQAKDAMNK